MSLIQLYNVTKLYGSVIGVNDISLNLDSGTYGLLGPNGSGKTTLINLILGQLRPTLGAVRLFGQDPSQDDRLFREVGLCPALEVNMPRVTAFEWVTYLVQLHGFARHEAVRLGKAALELVKLDHAMHRPMRDYSLGMRQRAKLAQAIAHQPRLLILDEPFNGLDPVARYEMTQFLIDWGRQGRSLILSSHILHEVEAVNPSFLLISGGRLLASGSPQEVREILADSPNQILIRCSDPRALGRLLAEHPTVDQLRIDELNRSLEVGCNAPATLLRDLSTLLLNQPFTITEIHSSDESLKELFATLLKFHRGETKIVRKATGVLANSPNDSN